MLYQQFSARQLNVNRSRTPYIGKKATQTQIEAYALEADELFQKIAKEQEKEQRVRNSNLQFIGEKMKTLVYLVCLVLIGLAIAWFGFGVHPKTVYYRVTGMFSSASVGATEQAGDLKDTGSRFVDVIKNNYNDQDMTQQAVH